jgi:hypothetical protein
LDIVYLRPGGDDEAFLRGLRIQRAQALDLSAVRRYADRSGKPKLIRADLFIERVADEDGRGWREL